MSKYSQCLFTILVLLVSVGCCGRLGRVLNRFDHMFENQCVPHSPVANAQVQQGAPIQLSKEAVQVLPEPAPVNDAQSKETSQWFQSQIDKLNKNNLELKEKLDTANKQLVHQEEVIEQTKRKIVRVNEDFQTFQNAFSGWETRLNQLDQRFAESKQREAKDLDELDNQLDELINTYMKSNLANADR